jgi:hypothetical protein
MKHLEELQPDVIVYERFDYRNRARKGLELISRELIGVAELYTQQHPQVILHKQTASSVMSYYNDNRLRLDLVYKPGKEHANDAVRHLLYWFTFGPGYKYNEHGFKAGS